jgi:hypothetical protein
MEHSAGVRVWQRPRDRQREPDRQLAPRLALSVTVMTKR